MATPDDGHEIRYYDKYCVNHYRNAPKITIATVFVNNKLIISGNCGNRDDGSVEDPSYNLIYEHISIEE